jgi:hypothetical protein
LKGETLYVELSSSVFMENLKLLPW